MKMLPTMNQNGTPFEKSWIWILPLNPGSTIAAGAAWFSAPSPENAHGYNLVFFMVIILFFFPPATSTSSTQSAPHASSLSFFSNFKTNSISQWYYTDPHQTRICTPSRTHQNQVHRSRTNTTRDKKTECSSTSFSTTRDDSDSFRRQR